jgi:hypothetical protein
VSKGQAFDKAQLGAELFASLPRISARFEKEVSESLHFQRLMPLKNGGVSCPARVTLKKSTSPEIDSLPEFDRRKFGKMFDASETA